VTYYWDFDGEHLTFELWGEDLRPHRKESYAQTYQRVEDPRVVVVAAADFPAGRRINIHAAKLGLVAAAELGPDAFTDREDVGGRVAAVPIAKGQAITPDVLEPLVE
jgi:flagella basal body P-ring formation protein FlgA